MKNIVLFAAMFLFANVLTAQKQFTRDAKITFHSDAALEKIEAVNNSSTSVIDTETSRIQFAVLVKGFQFEKALMQEHFNENYMESSKFPKATFKGAFSDGSAIDWTKDGEYAAEVTGEMTIHGVTKTVTAPSKIVIKGGAVSGSSTFTVQVADYDIEIPSVVKDNIAKTVEISVEAEYQKL